MTRNTGGSAIWKRFIQLSGCMHNSLQEQSVWALYQQAAYTILGLTSEGKKELLGLYLFDQQVTDDWERRAWLLE